MRRISNVITYDQAKHYWGSTAARKVITLQSLCGINDCETFSRRWRARYPKTYKWVSECHGRPGDDEIALSAMSEAIYHHGVENFKRGDGGGGFFYYYDTIEYTNSGDPYSACIMLIEHELYESQYHIGCQGDAVTACENDCVDDWLEGITDEYGYSR